MDAHVNPVYGVRIYIRCMPWHVHVVHEVRMYIESAFNRRFTKYLWCPVCACISCAWCTHIEMLLLDSLTCTMRAVFFNSLRVSWERFRFVPCMYTWCDCFQSPCRYNGSDFSRPPAGILGALQSNPVNVQWKRFHSIPCSCAKEHTTASSNGPLHPSTPP